MNEEMKTVGLADAEIGQRLRKLREAAGVRRERIALELDMSAENWRQYETGRHAMKLSYLPTLAGIFNLSLSDLVCRLFADPAIDGRVAGDQDERESAVRSRYNATYRETERPAWRPLPTRRPLVPA